MRRLDQWVFVMILLVEHSQRVRNECVSFNDLRSFVREFCANNSRPRRSTDLVTNSTSDVQDPLNQLQLRRLPSSSIVGRQRRRRRTPPIPNVPCDVPNRMIAAIELCCATIPPCYDTEEIRYLRRLCCG